MVVPTVSVLVNDGVPVVALKVAVGQLGAVQAGPVTTVESVIDRLVPLLNVAETVAVVPSPCLTLAALGVTDKP